MAGKSRRRGRHLPQTNQSNKKRKTSRGVKAPLASAPVAAVEQSSTPTPAEVRPPAVTGAPAPRAARARTLDVAGELRRIGIMGGAMVVVLVLLYFFLP